MKLIALVAELFRRGFDSRARLLAMVLILIAPHALADRSYSARYTINATGDIKLIGNTVMSCPDAASGCAAARFNTTSNDNDFNMVYVDVDGNATTFSSSSATLNLPVGASVLWAGLYWGGQSSNSARNQVLFQPAGAFGYSAISASQFDTSSGNTDVYQGYANVTAQVQAAGNGTYTVANVHSQPNTTNRWAGWSLIVVYGDNTQSLRNLSVFDGFALDPVTITTSGFLTPLSGPVVSRMGVVTYDPDSGTTGDVFTLNGVAITDATNPVDAAYNSTISDFGVHVTTKNPHYTNQLGFEIDRYNVPSGVLGNGATTATLVVDAPNENVYPGVITFATDIYVPVVVPNLSKSVQDVNGGLILAGDTLRYTISLSNTGQDTATNTVVNDNIPAGTTYVPGSLVVASGANAGAKSDAAGDDQAEYIASGTPRVSFRVGSSADATQGGNVPFNASTSVQFDVVVNSGLAAGTQLINTAEVSYTGQTLGETLGASATQSQQTVVTAAPSITKSFSAASIAVGGTSVLSIQVSNPASNPTTLTGVSFTDVYPAGLVNSSSPNPQISCSPGSTAGTVTGGAAGGNSIGLNPGATLAPNGSCTITVTVTSASAGNYVNTTGAVTSTNAGTGTTASATLAVGKPGITKAFTPNSILSGGVSRITFNLSNPNPSALSNVAFGDALTNMQVASTPNVTNTCGGSVSAPAGSANISLSGGVLAANGSCSIGVDVTSTTAGVHANTTSGVSSTESGAPGNASNTVTLTVVGPPTISKAFSPISVRPNVPSQLTLTVSNPNPTTTITGVAFTDSYPANLVNDNPANPTLNCSAGSSATLTGGGNGGTSIGLGAGVLAPGGSCTITVNVESGTAGNYNNSTGTVSSSNAGTGAAANATLNVTNLSAPTATKAFSPSTITRNGTSTLTITLSNSNGTAANGVNFNDSYPVNLFNSSTPGASTTCGGTVSAAANGTSISLSGGTIPANGSCNVTVQVTSADAGLYTNSTGTIFTSNAGTGASAIGQLNVLAPPQISKSFSPSDIGVAPNFATLTITLSNPTTATVALTSVQFTDNFPAGLVVASTPSATNSCGGSYTDAGGGGIGSGDTGIRLTGVTLNPNASCSVSVRVSSATAGAYVNTTGNVSSANGGTGGTATATLGVGRPAISKSFSPSTIPVNGSAQFTITLTNPTGSSMTAAAFTDTFPAGMTVATTPGASNSCGGSFTDSSGGAINAGDTGVSLSGGTIPANGSCTLQVNVTSATTLVNTIPAGALSTSAGTNANAATATLLVHTPIEVSKTFTPSIVTPGVVSRLEITLSNPNGVNATSVGFTDNYPVNLVNTGTPGLTNTCGGTATGVANGSLVSLSGATITANSSCSVAINVTSNTAGDYLNSTGNVTTSLGTASGASATLRVVTPATISKSFNSPTVVVNSPSTMTLIITNPNSIALTGMAFTDTFPAGLVVATSPSLTNTCGGAVTGASAGSTALGLSGGSLGAGPGVTCALSIAVASASAGTYNNTTTGVSSTEAGTGAVSNTAALTVIGGRALAGFAYSDANHNAARDGTEAGTGQSLFIKLTARSGTSCTAPALSAATVNAGTGAYTFSNLTSGDYCLILDTNSTLADITANVPAGWLTTETPSGIRQITVSTISITDLNFGLFNGARLSGRVFRDTGVGGATANDGVQNGAELGIGNVVVRALNAGCASSLCDAATTDGSGGYTLWIPAVASGSVNIAETNPGGFISTGGQSGNTGGAYNRGTDITTFTFAAGSIYTGVNFADVPDNSFTTDGAQSGLAGAVVFYPHSFTAGSAGNVGFATTNVATPALPGWSNLLYRDTNCNAVLDGTEGSLTFSGAALSAGEIVCLILKETIPAGAPNGAQDQVTVTATFTYTNAAPVLVRSHTRTDLTTVGTATGAGLTLTKTVDKATALPGEVLTYTITYTNNSSGALTNIAISDSTPAFTVYVGASAGCPNLVARTTCIVPVEPPANGTGALRWNINGTLNPTETGTVRYQVQIQ